MKQRAQHEAAEDDRQRQADRGGRQRQRQTHADSIGSPAHQHRHHDQQRRHRQILKQQHGETGAPDRQIEALALGEDGDDDGGRRHRQRRAQRQRRRRRLPQRQRQRAQQQRRQRDLRQAEAEHQTAHALEPLERQFEAHREEQEHHAERGDAVDRLDIGQRDPVEPRRVLREAPEPRRTQRHAGAEVAEHRADAHAEEQRRDNARRRQKQQRLLIDRQIEIAVHAASLVDKSGRATGQSSGARFRVSAWRPQAEASLRATRSNPDLGFAATAWSGLLR